MGRKSVAVVFAFVTACLCGCARFEAAAIKTVVSADKAVKASAEAAVKVREAELRALISEARARIEELGCPGTDDVTKAACAEAKTLIAVRRVRIDGRWETAKKAVIAAAGAVYATACAIRAYQEGAQDKANVMGVIANLLKIYGELRAVLDEYGVDALPEIPGL